MQYNKYMIDTMNSETVLTFLNGSNMRNARRATRSICLRAGTIKGNARKGNKT